MSAPASSFTHTKGMTTRIARDFKTFYASNNPTIFMKMVDDCAENIKVLIIAPNDSVYEGCFFFFDVILKGYPQNPPLVKFTSPLISERLHPNFYSCGKMCLSMINTWGTPEWSPILTFEKVFMTIQSKLDNNPITHEPGHEGQLVGNNNVVANTYATIARYQTLVNSQKWLNVGHPYFDKEMKSYFKNNYKLYKESVDKLEEFDGQKLSSMHASNVKINVNELRKRYEETYRKLQ